MKGEAVRQIVVNEETVSPLHSKLFSPTFSVVTSTTETLIVVKQGHTRLCDPMTRRISSLTCSEVDRTVWL